MSSNALQVAEYAPPLACPQGCMRHFSPLSRPPGGRRVAGQNPVGPQRHQMAALVRIAANLRAILAAQIAFQFVDRGRLRPADDIQADRLVRVAAEAADLEV